MSKDHHNDLDPLDRSNTGMNAKLIQPIYQAGKKLATRIHPRVWAITGILTVILVLLLIVYVGVMFLVDKDTVAQAETITVDQALRAPFDLDNRVLLAEDMPIDDVLPDSFGDFQQLTETEGETLSFGRLTSCLVDNGTFECNITYRPQYQATTRYSDNNGNTIEVVVANYWNERITTEAMVDAVHSAGEFSRVGDFVVAVGEIDYFYSTTSDWFSFTWAHGAWMFSVSAETPESLTSAVQAFPY